MSWYYAVGGSQKGPVSEQEFDTLVQQGVITSQTLVWREGMASWEPYAGAAAQPPATQSTVAEPDTVVCARCGGRFAPGEVITLEGRPYCAQCKPLAIQGFREGVVSPNASEEIRRQYLKHEASVKSIGFLYYLGGTACGFMTIAGFMAGAEQGLPGMLMGGLFLTLSIAQFWVGTGLRRLRRWARIPTGILSGIGLLGFPVGTLVNAYILYLVFSQKGKMVFSDEYRAIIEQTPHIKYRTSIVVWILLGLLLVLFAIGLAAALFGGRR